MKAFINFIVMCAVSFGLAWLLQIEPTKEYGWFMGLVHGAFFVPNYIISLFDPAWLTKAVVYTTMYNVDWWIVVVLNVFGWIMSVFGLIGAIFMKRR